MLKKIKHFFHKNTVVILSILFLVFFAGTMQLFAADPPPPLGGYLPGDSLDPGCLPTDPDCLVKIDNLNVWNILGNAGTVDGTNFIGTTDNVPLTFKVNNVQAGRLDNILGSSFYGYQAGFSNITGQVNVANGYQALYSNSSGNRNMAIGYAALYSNLTGNSNMAIGAKSLYFNVSGDENVAIGYHSLYNNQTSYNSAIGSDSLYNNTTGYENSALGYQSLYSNQTGYHNIAIGNKASYSDVIGAYNVAIGVNALYSNLTSWNIAFGLDTLYHNTTGYPNLAIGHGALFSNTTGGWNIAIGNNALRNTNSAAGYNFGIGVQALYSNISGTENNAIGNNALYAVTSGSYNFGAGEEAGGSITIGNYNTFIGHGAGHNIFQKVDVVNSIAIGHNVYTTADNQIVIGDSSNVETLLNGNVGIGNIAPGYKLHVGSNAVTDSTVLLRLEDINSTCDFTADAGGPTCGSDETLKKNIFNQESNLDKILALRPVTYNWLTDLDDTKIQHGFIAQEVAEIMPELVRDGTWIDGTTKKFLQTGGMMPYVVGAIKELDLKVEDLILEKQNLFSNLISWFGNTANGIGDFFANRIRTKEICVSDEIGETCITKSQLDQILLTSGTVSSGSFVAPEIIPDPEVLTCEELGNCSVTEPESDLENVEGEVGAGEENFGEVIVDVGVLVVE